MDATGGTYREIRSEATGPAHATDVDASLGNGSRTGAPTGTPATRAVGVSAERILSGPGTIVVTALVATGLAAAAAVMFLLRRRRRRANAVGGSAPADEPRPEPSPEASPRPRRAAPKFVVDDDTGEFPSLR
ncbi:hypothetical protein [Myceligenerans halotolerans]